MDAEFIRRRFEEISKERKLSKRWLSDSLHINRYSINKILRGDIRKGKDQDRLRQIIEKLGFTEEWFFKGALPTPQFTPDRGQIPLFGDIPTASPAWSQSKPQPVTWIGPPPDNNHKRMYALRVRGQSMSPAYLPNDIVYLEPLTIRIGPKDPQNPIPRLTFERINNRVVAAILNGEATLKRLVIKPVAKRDDYELHLLPLNPEYSTIVIQPDTSAIFHGVVIGLYRSEA